MTWVFAILVVLALGGVAAAAAGRWTGLAADDEETYGAPRATDVPLDAAGLRSVRFGLAVRGYRMADVDALLDRLAEREAERESGREAGREDGDGHEVEPERAEDPPSDR